MEPFVPEPEERIAAKDQTPSGSRSALGRPGILAVAVATAVVAVGLGGFLAASGDPADERLDELNAQVAELQARVAELPAAAEAAPVADDSGAGLSQDDSERLGRLEKLVASQVSDLETMRMMVSETLSRLDANLEGSLLNYYEKNRQAIDQLSSQMAELDTFKATLASVKTELDSLGGKMAASGKVNTELSEGLVRLEASLGEYGETLSSVQGRTRGLGADLEKMATQLVEVSGQLEGKASNESLESLAGTLRADLAASADQLMARMASDMNSLREQQVAIEGATGRQMEELASALQERVVVADVRKALSPLGEQVAALGQRLEGIDRQVGTLAPIESLQQLSGNTEASVKQLRAQVADVQLALDDRATNGELSNIQTVVAGELSALKQSLAAIDGKVEGLVPMGVLSEMKSGVDERLVALDGRVKALDTAVAGRASDADLSALREELSALNGQSGNFAPLALVEEIKSGLASQASQANARIAELQDAVASKVARDDVESLISTELTSLQQRLEAVDGQLASLVAREEVQQLSASLSREVDALDKRIAALDGALSSTVPGEHLTQLQGRLENGVGSLESQIAEMRKTLATTASSQQLAQLDSRLGAGLEAVEGKVAEVRKGLDAKVSTQRVEQLATSLNGDVDGLRQQLGKLGGELARARELLSAQQESHGKLAGQVSAVSASASASTSAGTVSADMQARLAALHDTQEGLIRDLRATQGRLQTLATELGNRQPQAASAPAARQDITALKDQLADLSAELDRSRQQLAAHDTEMDRLRGDLEARITATRGDVEKLVADARGGDTGSLDTQVAKILQNIELLKKHHPYTEFVD